jgi:oligoendopeptidase F
MRWVTQCTRCSHDGALRVSDFTIFVAGALDTLRGSLDHWLATAADKDEQIVLLQHHRQHHEHVLHAGAVRRPQLAAHKLVEERADHVQTLNALYKERFGAYYGDSVDMRR